MRTMHLRDVAIFLTLASAVLCISGCVVWIAFPMLAWAGEFRSIISSILGITLGLLLALVTYRLFLFFVPLPEGEIAISSRDESIYHIHLLFFLFFFYPIMKSNLLPVPLLRLFYLGLGARLGSNTYSGGILFDPAFIVIGSNTIVGQGAMLIPHVIEGHRLAHHPIRIGNEVTIGANAIILSDVEVGDNVIIAVGSVVPKGTRIPSREIWGGIPAKPLGRVAPATSG